MLHILILIPLIQERHVRAKSSIDWDLQDIQSDTQWAYLTPTNQIDLIFSRHLDR